MQLHYIKKLPVPEVFLCKRCRKSIIVVAMDVAQALFFVLVQFWYNF